MKHSAIVLSGGKNRRMGHKNKAFLTIDGKTMIEHVISKLNSFDEIIIVTNSPEEYSGLGVRVITDIIPNRGPMSGMHAGLYHAENEYSFIISCDMPFVPTDYIDHCLSLKKDYDVAVPYWGDCYEPTCGMYSKDTIPHLESGMNSHTQKPISIYPHTNVHKIEKDVLDRFGDANQMFMNINTMEEYKELKNTSVRKSHF